MRSCAALVAGALVLAACGGDDGTAPATTASPPTSAETGACPGVAPPLGEEASTGADANGDGEEDRATLEIVDATTLRLVVAYAGGGATRLALADDSVLVGPDVRVERVVDVDGDGDDDLWLVVGTGATVEVVTLVLAEGCELVRPSLDGQANRFPVGAGARDVAGVECTDGGLVASTGVVADDGTIAGTERILALDGDELVPALEQPFAIDPSTPDPNGRDPSARVSLRCDPGAGSPGAGS